MRTTKPIELRKDEATTIELAVKTRGGSFQVGEVIVRWIHGGKISIEVTREDEAYTGDVVVMVK